MAKVAFTGGALNVTALLTGLTGTALTKALAKIAAFEAKVEAGKSASLKIGTDTFEFKKASGVQAVTFTNNGTAFTTAAALTTAATAPTPTPSPTPAPTVAPQALTTTAGETLFGVAGTNDTFTATDATYQSTDIIVDSSTKDADVLNVTVTDDVTATPITVGIETANFTLQAFSTAGTADTFEVAATNLSANAISVDLDKVGSAIAKAAVTGVKTGTTVTSSSDFATALTVSGRSDDESLTVSTAAAGVTVDSAGTLAAATVSSSSASAVTITTDTDGTATLTTTGAGLTVVAAAAKTLTATAAGNLVIGAAAATSVTASAAGTIDANTTDLTAATSATLTATKSIDVGFAAAASATLSAGGTTASTIDDAGTTLASLSLSGNGSAHSFDITDAEGVKSVTITGTQAVSIIASAADIDTLTDNKLTIVDNSSATSTLRVGTAAGDMDLSAAAVDGISLEVDNNSKSITLANKASLTVTTDQTALTVDGTTATGSTDSLTVSLNDGATGGAVDLTALTITDFGSVIINASADDAASAITAVTATDNNTNVTINTGALGATLNGAINVGTGSLAVNATGAGALATTSGTSGSFTAASVAVTAGTGGVTGAGAYAADTVTISSGGAIATGAITLGKTATITGTGSGAVSVGAVTKSGTAAALTINGGAGAVTLAATNLGTGALSISTTGAATTSSTVAAGSVSITAAGYTASGAINVGSTGTVTINSSAAVALGAQAITAASLTTSGAGAVTYTAINSTTLDSVTTGSGADALTVSNITATLTVNGGAGNDTITIGGNSGSSTVASIVGGDGSLDTVVVADTVDLGTAGTVTFSGIERISIADNGAAATTATFAAGQLSGQTFIMTAANEGDTVALGVVLGTSTTIDLSKLVIDTARLTAADGFEVDGSAKTSALTLTASSLGDSLTGGTVNDTITGGSGADSLIGGDGADSLIGGAGADSVTGGVGNDTINLTESSASADTVNYSSGTDGADTIIGFAAGAGADLYDTDFTPTGLDADYDIIDSSTSATTVTLTVAATGEVFEFGSANALKAAITDFSNGAQVLAAVSGTSSVEVDTADDDCMLIVYSGGNAYLYEVANTGLTVTAGEITLVGTFTGITAGAFSTGDIV